MPKPETLTNSGLNGGSEEMGVSLKIWSNS